MSDVVLDQDNEEVLFHGKIFDVVKRYQIGRSGKKLTRHVVKHPGAVAILPVLPDGRVVLLKQYRVAVDQFILEIPAGTREPQEDPMRTAERELIEETGYHAGKMRLISTFYSSPGILQEQMHFYLATDLVPGESALEDGEDITVQMVTKSEIESLLQKGNVLDGKTIIALQWFLLANEKGEC